MATTTTKEQAMQTITNTKRDALEAKMRRMIAGQTTEMLKAIYSENVTALCVKTEAKDDLAARRIVLDYTADELMNRLGPIECEKYEDGVWEVMA
jgi:hypothetical protein